LAGGYVNVGPWASDTWVYRAANQTWFQQCSPCAWPGRGRAQIVHAGNLLVVQGGTDGTNTLADLWGSWDEGRNWFELPSPRASQEHVLTWYAGSLISVFGALTTSGTAYLGYQPRLRRFSCRFAFLRTATALGRFR
jgi:hypothetical protein